jgi:hypothetical protein
MSHVLCVAHTTLGKMQQKASLREKGIEKATLDLDKTASNYNIVSGTRDKY